MKKLFCSCLVALVLTGMPFAVLAEDNIGDSAKVMEALVSQLRTLLSADNILGTPQEFNGTTVIPVTGYCFGFGAGSGSGTTKLEAGSGGGGGGGGGIMPTSLLVIGKDGSVEVMSLKKNIASEVVSSLAPLILEAIKAQQMNKPAPKAKTEAAKE